MDSRKRGMHHGKVNGTAKKSKSESELSRSKTKPCMKYFSMDGCPFGENCHFLHFFPGGYNAVAQLMNLPSIPTATQNGAPSTATIKSKLCKKYATAEGCKFGSDCHFAHGDHELGKAITSSPHTHNYTNTHTHTHTHTHNLPPFPARHAPPPSAATFGATATAKISFDASLTGTIIGHGGENSKHISRQTGAKLAIRDHETDSNLKNIELEGTFDQIKEASGMVRELISNASVRPGPGHGLGLGPGLGHLTRPPPGMFLHGGGGPPPHASPMGGTKKTKLCDNFAKGSCTFGERCHFAHGATELRKTRV